MQSVQSAIIQNHQSNVEEQNHQIRSKYAQIKHDYIARKQRENHMQ